MFTKNRIINTRFWSDNFVTELEPLERYLFLYFLTNAHTDICGIYELPLKIILFETSVTEDVLRTTLEKLKGRIHYFGGWVYIRNFTKHQNADNPSVQRSIQKSLLDIPSDVLDKIKEIDTLDIPSIQGGDILPVRKEKKRKEKKSYTVTSNSTPSIHPVPTPTTSPEPDQITSLLKEFETINPTLNYGNTTERRALTDLIAKLGFEQTQSLTRYAISVQGKQYAPVITTPYQLKLNLGKLRVYYVRENGNKTKNINLDNIK